MFPRHINPRQVCTRAAWRDSRNHRAPRDAVLMTLVSASLPFSLSPAPHSTRDSLRGHLFLCHVTPRAGRLVARRG